MKTGVLIICVFSIFNFKYVEPLKLAEKITNDVTIDEHFMDPAIRAVKVINNENTSTINDIKKEVNRNSQRSSGKSVVKNVPNNVLNFIPIIEDENTQPSKKKLLNSKLHRNKSKHIEISKAKQNDRRLKNDRATKVALQMSTLSVNECSSDKERTPDGTCATIEVDFDSKEILDLQITTTESTEPATEPAT